jgi:hypothetical protein
VTLHSVSYNLSNCQSDLTYMKEELTYMKSRMEVVESTQRISSVDDSKNYYLLFYKLLDIVLTVAAIVLMVFTHMIASIKFLFLLYPRFLVFVMLLYTFFYYFVDFNKLTMNMVEYILDDSDPLNNKLSPNHEHSRTLFIKIIRSIYEYAYHLNASSNSTLYSTSLNNQKQPNNG